jgi:hypothetical protein
VYKHRGRLPWRHCGPRTVCGCYSRLALLCLPWMYLSVCIRERAQREQSNHQSHPLPSLLWLVLVVSVPTLLLLPPSTTPSGVMQVGGAFVAALPPGRWDRRTTPPIPSRLLYRKPGAALHHGLTDWLTDGTQPYPTPSPQLETPSHPPVDRPHPCFTRCSPLPDALLLSHPPCLSL